MSTSSQPLPPATNPPPPDLSFAELGALGRNQWWRYVAVVGLTVPLWLIISTIVAALGLVGLRLFDPAYRTAAGQGGGSLQRFASIVDGVENWSAVSQAEAATVFLVNVLPFALGLCLILLLIIGFHRRPMRSLITAAPRFRWAGLLTSFTVLMAIALVLLAVGLLVTPEEFRIDVNWSHYMIVLPIGLLLIPIQVLTEELVFRGYLLQMIARLTALRIVWYIAPSALFAGLHLFNPEAQSGGVWALAEYGVLALYLMVLVVRGNGLEYAVGFHLALNIFALLIVTSSVSLRLAPAPVEILHPDFRLGFFLMSGACLVHYLMVFKVFKA